MKRALYVCITVALVVAFISATEKRAFAYIDPGSSLVLYQGASSVVLGVVYYFRRKLKSILLGTPGDHKEGGAAS